MTETTLMRQQNFVGGQWVSAAGAAQIEVINPATGARIGSVPRGGRAETAAAIDAAARAFPAWSKTTAHERAALMMKLYDALMANQAALGQLLTEEMGKPLAEAKGEIAFGANYIKWFAEEAKRIYGDVIPTPWPGKRILVTKQPVGVVGAITPWNFPNSMIARKLGAALAAGCTLVIKPASQTPYSALALAALCEAVGLPPGVVNVITGAAADIAAEMCENPRLRKITFTGSTAVGKKLAAAAGAHMKRVSMELGGNAPFIVFDDADLDAAVAGAMISKFRNTGQTCVCANRILVQDGVYDAFAAKLTAAVAALQVGNGMEPGVEQGPLIDSAAVAKVEEHVADVLARGGKLAVGGERHPLGQAFYQPTVMTDVARDALVAREETFGPLAPLFRFKTEAEAIALANDTEYGLACYFYTRDLGRSWRVMEGLEYGLVGINEGLISTEVAPFGGVKDSGMGTEGSKYGVADYIDIKYACVGGLGL
ncbi:NAD-dependent succinate-semialdehyde dehydrogenase [Exilibacterium tricleocarpae]|uniref:NAD-dependent succinate-semialdehyde dehydrogenase n=1 Tax=Exilibacterium tricleocarpae TaxID=2591008 RepID=A0A545SRZ8_9GAMM|nr:NAD-dependent succinate-semialdehyde dehydrogenase [Exilibacterium tricleocarpae]TQV67732.1 NAD-dependent succinate-semialdehyde dehydrogenase [Exilibacterium tricleocarpae]